MAVSKKALLYACDREGQAILKNFENPVKLSHGVYSAGNYLVYKTGVGKANTRKAVSRLFQLYPVSSVIMLGTAGAMDKKLKAGDIFVANKIINVVDGDLKEEFSFNSGSLDTFSDLLKGKGHNFKKAALVTVDKPLLTKKQKEEFFAKYHAKACDMESAVVAEIAGKNDIPFYCLRVISDSLNQRIPAPEIFLHTEKGLKGFLKKIIVFIKNPLQLVRLVRFKKSYSLALLHLESVVRIMIGKGR